MKLAAYRSDGRKQLGVVVGDGSELVPLAAAWKGEGAAPTDLTDLIERGRDAVRSIATEGARRLRVADVTLTAPIPRPRRNVFCIGRNYAEHAAEFAKSGYDATGGASAHPDAAVFFTKPPSTVIGHGELIEPHLKVTSELDYEAELGVIIGRGGRGITRGEALSHVWGYTIINDVTARDLQKRHKQWFLGKGLDTFCPMGPWAVTADEIGDAPLDLRCTVNGEERQSASTSDLIFDIPAIIETLSAGITLEPGDVIATGTPKGVGIGFEPPKFLRPGDVVEITINKIGVLRNQVGAGK
jgi:2-keto-4-pentenoate hydratase/2-oxohepta-3-ene-1,7-dioic acid hydratase in catechol pathway